MIINISSRTDIPAFYSKWLENRLEAGFFDVRNPFYPKSVSRIELRDVDAIMFCTKNPIPLLPMLSKIRIPVLMDVTITPYHREIEPKVPDKNRVIEAVRQISEIIGSENVAVRYDPVFISDRYSVDYHIRAFEKLCSRLEGAASQITFSFLDPYKNTLRNKPVLKDREPDDQEKKKLAESFLKIAQRYGIEIFTCNEKNVLAEYGISDGACFSQRKAFEMTGKWFPKWKARECGCVEMADVGVYNSCPHLCAYCYANYDEKLVMKNVQAHDPESSMLIGHLHEDDEIRVRKDNARKSPPKEWTDRQKPKAGRKTARGGESNEDQSARGQKENEQNSETAAFDQPRLF